MERIMQELDDVKAQLAEERQARHRLEAAISPNK